MSKSLYKNGAILLMVSLFFKVIVDITVMNVSFVECMFNTICFAAFGTMVGIYILDASYLKAGKLFQYIFMAMWGLMIILGERALNCFNVLRFRPCIVMIPSVVWTYSRLINDNKNQDRNKILRYVLIFAIYYGFERANSYFDVRIVMPIVLISIAVCGYLEGWIQKKDLMTSIYIFVIPVFHEIMTLVDLYEYNVCNYFLLERHKSICSSGLLGAASCTFREFARYSADELIAFVYEQYGLVGTCLLHCVQIALILYVWLVYKQVKNGFSKLILTGIITHWSSVLLLSVFSCMVSPSTVPPLLFGQYNMEVTFFFIEFFIVLRIIRKELCE